MLGSLLDRFYVAFENRNGEIPKEIQQIQTQGKNSEKWICFLPEGILKFFYTRRILSGRNCDIYVIPKTAIFPFSGHCETILYFSRNFAISQ